MRVEACHIVTNCASCGEKAATRGGEKTSERNPHSMSPEESALPIAYNLALGLSVARAFGPAILYLAAFYRPPATCPLEASCEP